MIVINIFQIKFEALYKLLRHFQPINDSSPVTLHKIRPDNFHLPSLHFTQHVLNCTLVLLHVCEDRAVFRTTRCTH